MMKQLTFLFVSCLVASAPAFAQGASASSMSPQEFCSTLAKISKMAAGEAKRRPDRDIFQTQMYKSLQSSTSNEGRKALFNETFSVAESVIREDDGNAEKVSVAVEAACLKA